MKKLLLALALMVLASPAYAQCGAGQPPAGTVCAAPAGSAGVATYRLLGNGHIPSGIDAAKIGGGSVSTTEYDRLNGITAFGQSIVDDADAAAVRATIGTAIGTNVQAFDADLTTWAGISPSADMQSLAAAANYAAMRALLDLEAGTDFYSIAGADAAFQPLDADLTALSAAAFSRATASTASWLRLFEDTDNGTNYIEFIAPASIGTNRQCQLVDGGAPIPDSCVGDGVDDGAGGGISDIVQDLTPQLGGALDTNGFAIELGSGNTDTSLTRSAAGQISVEGVVIPTVSSTSTLTNKTLTAPVISTISNTGTITLPTATTTLVGRDTTDTLTNKSIAATQITAGALNIGNNAATVGTVEMANGTSNTLSASGGVLSIEGIAVPTISSTHTLTNKTISGGSNTITGIDSTAITDGAVANADLANMAQATVKGRAAGAGTGAPVDLSQTQLTAIVNTFTTSLSGAAPASGGGTTNFLRADGTWAAPGGGGGGWTTVTKSADTTRNTNTTTSADPDLQFSLSASTTYAIRIVIKLRSTAAGDFKWGISGPASPTEVYGADTSGTIGSNSSFEAYPANVSTLGAAAGAKVLLIELTVENGPNAGTLSFDWAQNTSDAGPTTVKAGSYIEYRTY